MEIKIENYKYKINFHITLSVKENLLSIATKSALIASSQEATADT